MGSDWFSTAYHLSVRKTLNIYKLPHNLFIVENTTNLWSKSQIKISWEMWSNQLSFAAIDVFHTTVLKIVKHCPQVLSKIIAFLIADSNGWIRHLICWLREGLDGHRAFIVYPIGNSRVEYYGCSWKPKCNNRYPKQLLKIWIRWDPVFEPMSWGALTKVWENVGQGWDISVW